MADGRPRPHEAFAEVDHIAVTTTLRRGARCSARAGGAALAVCVVDGDVKSVHVRTARNDVAQRGRSRVEVQAPHAEREIGRVTERAEEKLCVSRRAQDRMPVVYGGCDAQTCATDEQRGDDSRVASRGGWCRVRVP